MFTENHSFSILSILFVKMIKTYNTEKLSILKALKENDNRLQKVSLAITIQHMSFAVGS